MNDDYATQGSSLLDKLNELFGKYVYCLNTIHSYELDDQEQNLR